MLNCVGLSKSHGVNSRKQTNLPFATYDMINLCRSLFFNVLYETTLAD